MITTGTARFYERSQMQGTRLRSEGERLQNQIATGQRLARPSDDPLAAARLRELSRAQSLATVDAQVAGRAETHLGLAAEAIGSVAHLVMRAKELAMQAGSATVSAEGRRLIGIDLATLGDALLDLANSPNGSGHPLFGGTGNGPAYVASATGASYQGTAAAPTADLGNGQQLATGLTGPELFEFTRNGVAGDLFSVVSSVARALETGDPSGQALAMDAIGGLDAVLDKLTTGQTVIGARLAWIDNMADTRMARGEFAASEQAALGETDLAVTISQLQHTMTILEASQAGFVKLANLSLFDLLR